MTDLQMPEFSVQQFTNHQMPPLLAFPGGLSSPEQAFVFAVDGYSLVDGGLEDCNTFGSGQTPALVALLDDDKAQKVFAQINTYLGGRRAQRELAGDEREAMAAMWPEHEGKRLVMIADAGPDNEALPMHQVWEEIARTLGMGAYEEGSVRAHHRFDASRLASPDPVGQAIARLLPAPPARAPSP